MDDDTTRRDTQPVALAEIDWDKLDKTKFYVWGAGMFTGVTMMLYPIALVKTRLQVVSHDAVGRNAYSVIKGLLKSDGISGLFKGFGTVVFGMIPARIVFITALEKTKLTASKMIEPLSLSQPTQAAVANGVAGMMASTCSQAVYVPVDVVSQRLMVQGYSGHATYSGGLDVACKIIKSDGIRGLYRGFGLSIMAYSPSNAVWWASYGASQHMIRRPLAHGNDSFETDPSTSKILLAQASGGIFAAATATCFSTPLDTIKTRLQVMEHGKKPTIKQVARNLIAEDGWTGLYRGLGARFCSMSVFGTSMIMSYEYLKRISAVHK